MSSETTTPPWRNGFWFNEKMPCTIVIVDGERMGFNNMIGLDFPDIEGSVEMVGKFGEFGAAKEQISAATGAKVMLIRRNRFNLLNLGTNTD